MSPTLHTVEDLTQRIPPYTQEKRLIGSQFAINKYLTVTRGWKYEIVPKYEYMSLYIGRFWDSVRDRGMMLYMAETDHDGTHWVIVGENLALIKKEIKRYFQEVEGKA